MNFRKNRFIKGFLALLATVAVLFAAQTVWMDYAVASPLDKALHDISGVKKVTLHDAKKFNEPVIINVALDSNVNLAKTYAEINEKIVDKLDRKPYVLKLEDNRTPELEQLYYEINFYVQKSIVDGNFPILAETAEKKASSIDADARVYVDEKSVYLQLSKNGSFLYTVVSRPAQRIGGDI